MLNGRTKSLILAELTLVSSDDIEEYRGYYIVYYLHQCSVYNKDSLENLVRYSSFLTPKENMFADAKESIDRYLGVS
jgi:hypothetical protein